MKKRILSLLLCLVMLVSLFAGLAVTASAAEPTSASEVKYVKDGGYVYNWGKRDTVATFLTTYAANYYTGSYSFDTLASKAGNSNSGTAFYSSALGTAIHNMLTSKQTYTTSYDSLKNFFRYTECEESSTSLISSYYSGTSMGNTWGSGWNREHTWPNSKGLDGSDENDVMMIKPTIEEENSDRGNKAYGEGSGYYDPNECGKQMHGDVARLMLQHLMRWGNTSYFYGTGGVMESRDILLKWLKEDPVDTWELGRNDAVQQITGVRNIFVDYPELAFLLLGEEIPDIDSPSGKAHELNGGGCIHNWKVTREVPATCTADGCLYYTCSLCNATKTEPIAAKGHQYNDSGVCTVCGADLKAGAFVLTDAPQDGDEVIIFNPGSSRAVSAVIKGSYYLDYADITPASKTIETENDAVIWKVSKTGSSYKFTNKAGTLSINWDSASSKTSLSLDGANPEMTLERCNAANSTYYIYSATQSGRYDHIYLEHFAQYNDFSAYDTSTDRASEKDFGFQFYAKTSGACTHNWTKTSSTAATCTEDGITVYTCSLCGATKNETVPALNHIDANSDNKCDRCGIDLGDKFTLTSMPKDGEEVIIYNPGSGRAVPAEIKSNYYLNYFEIQPVGDTMQTDNEAIIWKVSKVGGNYTFTNAAGTLSINYNGKTSISLDGANPEMTLESCNTANSTYYIYSATQTGNYDHIYLEQYSAYNEFSAYDTGSDRVTEQNFGFQFFARTASSCTHNWTKTSSTAATCTEDGITVYTCSLCGKTKTETVPATGHSFGNDNVCDICGYTKPAAGGQVVIYYPTGSKVMTTEEYTYTGKTTKVELAAADAELAGDTVFTDAENVALFTEIDNGDGTVTFKTSDGKFLYADGTDVKLVSSEGENTKFVLEEVTGGVYIRCATAQYNGKAQYLEFYSGYFTVYGMGADTSIYTFGIYPVASDCEHNWEKTSETAATCTAAGSTVYTCSLCGEKKTETVPALGHKPVTDEAVAATCTEPGKTEGSHCSVCNAILTAQTEIPAAGHKPVTDTAVAPTCTEPGKTEGSHCYVCNVILSAQTEVPALGHDWDEGTVTKEATEDEDGEKLYTCSRCGETRTEVIPALNHEHKFTETVVAPTCTEQGYTLHECYCGESYKDNYVDALGHTPVTDEAVAPTCTEPGKTEGSHCERCGEIIVAQEELAALGHNVVIDEAVAATCTEPGKTTGAHCSVCGEIIVAQEEIPATGHNYENGVCTDCGAEDPNYEPPTDPIETDPIETEPIETEPVETEPIETEPIETEPVETEPIATEPIETEPTEPVDPCEGYIDIDRSSWYHEAADFVLARGIMSSTKTDAKTFEPYTVCTRSMIATMLYSLEGKPAVSFEAKFPDVKENQWFTDAVMWAYQKGVVTGYDNGNFGPNDKVTREQMAVILKAYAEKVKGIDTSETADLSKFADAAKVTWSKPYITWAVAEGMLSGKAVGDKLNLDPQGNATRAEVAAIMRSFITNIIEAAK